MTGKKGGVPWVFEKDTCDLLQGGYAMQEHTADSVGLQAESAKDVLTEILQEGAHKMLATAIKAEVDALRGGGASYKRASRLSREVRS